MSTIERLKAEAATLEAKARAAGQTLKHCTALEQVARRHGHASWRACRAVQARAPEQAPPPSAAYELKRYTSQEWGFSLDTPKHWNAFPAVPSDSPFEIIRFASLDDGYHKLIVYRLPCDPAMTAQARCDAVQQSLAKQGFINFVPKVAGAGARDEFTLDFEQAREEGAYHVRHYSFFAGTLSYRLAFSSPRWAAMAALFEHMAGGFECSEK